MTENYTLYGAKGGGSMIVEAAFAFADIPLDFVEVDWEEIWNKSNPRLMERNPLGQVPTLVMPDQSVMTESAAIILHLADLKPEANLVPPIGRPERQAFLRWLAFLVSAVYPTFTYGDKPERWVGEDEAATRALKESTAGYRKVLWRHVESEIDGPWYLGKTWSALDLYICAMTCWWPGPEWFRATCPKLYRIGRTMQADPLCRAVLARNGLPEE